MPEALEREGEILLAAAEELLKLRNSSGWGIFMAQMEADSKQAMEKFEFVDVRDANAVARCQDDVKRYRYFSETLDILISQGFETEDIQEDEIQDD